jgi:hypothetical protein
VQPNQQQERQQADAAKVERHGNRLMVAAVEPTPGEVEADERQAEDQDRSRHPVDGAINAMRDEIEERAGKEEERTEVQRNLRWRQRPARHNPVVVSRLKGAVRIGDPAGSCGCTSLSRSHSAT